MVFSQITGGETVLIETALPILRFARVGYYQVAIVGIASLVRLPHCRAPRLRSAGWWQGVAAVQINEQIPVVAIILGGNLINENRLFVVQGAQFNELHSLVKAMPVDDVAVRRQPDRSIEVTLGHLMLPVYHQ
jgi:hypothetical protein